MTPEKAHEAHIHLIEQDALYKMGELTVHAPSGIYHPHEHSSSRLILAALGGLPLPNAARVLEIGCGTGIVALSLAQRGCEVVATDILARACTATAENARLNNLNLDIRCADLWTAVRPEEKFDLIVFNAPLMDKAIDHPAEIALCDPSGLLLQQFLDGLEPHMSPDAYVLFTWANISASLPAHWLSRTTPILSRNFGNGMIFHVYALARTPTSQEGWA